ncbi:zinc transporter ZIP13 [Osmerus eperlanus]|uniref:zinc transporter ZIP13 n=1 Tax=Osmerus eperlanus TaxID=29151 RepID=UPI002E0F4281
MNAEGRGPGWALAALLTGATLLVVVASRRTSSSQKMSQTTMAQATATAAGSGPWLAEDLLGFHALAELFSSERADVWFCSLVGSVAVGLSGIFPLLVIPLEAGAALKTEAGCRKLKQLLSFAIGGLLGDVFLHLLPEAWAHSCSSGGRRHHYQSQGLWVILGLLSFLLLEKMFPDQGSQEEQSSHSVESSGEAGQSLKNGHCSDTWTSSSRPKISQQDRPGNIKTSGYLNLLANCIDNFTHGLAVAGSFLVSRKVGFLTTFAILLHEIPHEVGDFAILLRAGFDHWSAARMQLYTALGGVLGACFALCAQSPRGTENTTSWILPFTSGGFLYIALVNVVPDLLQENNLRQSVVQILLLCCGIAVMALMSVIVD